jgi:hypothetical protein
MIEIVKFYLMTAYIKLCAKDTGLIQLNKIKITD